ncbi:unnamed protein product [Clavelina lepadiformis]|uniref:Uncharacterized protein n=1 Tax=Clavelina lepadiformis TaxID=159417 RepID=A0ABP0GX96_CLALP
MVNCKDGEKMATSQALRHLQDIDSNCPDGEFSDSENLLSNDAFPSAVESDEESFITESSDEDTDKDSDAVIDSNENDEEKGGFLWQKLSISQSQRGDLQQRCKCQAWSNCVSNKPCS